MLLQWKEERNPISCYGAGGMWPLHTCSRVCRVSGGILQNDKWLHHFPRDLHLLIVMTGREKLHIYSNESQSQQHLLQRDTSRAADLTVIEYTCELFLFPLGNQNSKQHDIGVC